MPLCNAQLLNDNQKGGTSVISDNTHTWIVIGNTKRMTATTAPSYHLWRKKELRSRANKVTPLNRVTFYLCCRLPQYFRGYPRLLQNILPYHDWRLVDFTIPSWGHSWWPLGCTQSSPSLQLRFFCIGMHEADSRPYEGGDEWLMVYIMI